MPAFGPRVVPSLSDGGFDGTDLHGAASVMASKRSPLESRIGLKALCLLLRRGGRADECGGLENR